MSRGIAASGARLIVTARDERRLKRLCQELREDSYDVLSCTCDLSDIESRRKLIEFVAANCEQLDILVHNAHGARAGAWSRSEEEDFLLAQQLAVYGPYHMTEALLPQLERAGAERQTGASVIFISSMYGSVSPDPRIYGDSGLNSPPHYGAVKAGMLQLTRYLAVHWAEKNIRVNAISPGPFPRLEFQKNKPSFCDRLVQKVPIRRLGQPDELLGPLLFLASPASSYITGINLPVDGGWTAW
jgi:NAD(P)-dependent dehydrogenase (short-subunit alcohol dehydrogenase family)